MNWDDLRVFLAVARSGQVARASPLLGLDATTVGRRIQRLEKALGQVLFERHRDGHRLTEAGERLVSRAEQMDQAVQHVHDDEPGAIQPGGIVRVSASEGFGTWFIARHLGRFGQRFPSIGIDLVATNGFLSPFRRETDVAILLARPRRGPLVARKLTDYGLRLFASRDYLDAAPAIDRPADLRRHPLIGYIPDFVYAPELHYLKEVADKLEPHLRSSSINAQHQLASSGNGVAILPCFIGDIDPRLVRVLPEVRIQRTFWLVAHQDTRGLERVRFFVDWLVGMTAAHRDELIGA
jgi:DNA-binding transcriptional LysR family regulator